MTSTQAIALFKTALQGNNYCPKTVRAYTEDVAQFTTWLATESVSAEEPQTITKLDINKFLGHLANQETTGKTRYRKVVAIKKFFVFLKENKIIKYNPAETVIPPLNEKPDWFYIIQKRICYQSQFLTACLSCPFLLPNGS